MFEAKAPEKEAVQKRVADTVAGDKRKRLIRDCLRIKLPIVHPTLLWYKLTNSQQRIL